MYSYNFATIIGFDCNLLQIRTRCHRAYETTVKTLTWYAFSWSFLNTDVAFSAGRIAYSVQWLRYEKDDKGDHISIPGRDRKKNTFLSIQTSFEAHPAAWPTGAVDPVSRILAAGASNW